MSVLLPQELLEAIFDRVDNISTLKAGALAGPRLAEPCQRNIFRKLRVFAESEAWRPSLQAAAAFFSTHQHLCAHVRDLTIHLSTTHSDSAALRYLLGAFRPDRLVISGRSVLWSSLASDVSQGLITCFESPALRRLHLRHLASIPRDVLAVALSVPVVALTYASGVPHEPSPLTTIGAVPQRPRRLILTESDLKEYRFLLEGGLLSGVDQLELELGTQYPETCSSPDKLLLSACAESLTQVVLGLGYLSHPISIPTLPHVRSAVIHVGLDALWIPDPPPFPMTLTNIVRALPALKNLGLHFTISWAKPEDLPWDELCGFPSDVWKGLESVHCRLVHHGRAELQPSLIVQFKREMHKRMPDMQGLIVCDIVKQPANASRI
ncbi:Nudix hydrolase domain-containing protein [Mycena chlorophos]|uniref:Nudix hydrolase domain-containing protein n=1 Tax=Mycena chlorophos TaxID=658473 RepID=A0A8H6SM04_MYCCL|nr:Nudix hydrolase domain-containing protein [Mycena chlorophos]